MLIPSEASHAIISHKGTRCGAPKKKEQDRCGGDIGRLRGGMVQACLSYPLRERLHPASFAFAMLLKGKSVSDLLTVDLGEKCVRDNYGVAMVYECKETVPDYTVLHSQPLFSKPSAILPITVTQLVFLF